MAYHFEKWPRFNFKCGQSSDLTLPNPPKIDSEGNVRTVSTISAPSQVRYFSLIVCGTGHLTEQVPLGTAVKMDSAIGSFITQEFWQTCRVSCWWDRYAFSSIARQPDHD